MATVNTHKFSLGNQKHTLNIYVPPSLNGHTIRVSVDSSKGKGVVVVLRHDNNSENDETDLDQHDLSDELTEIVKQWQPFAPSTSATPSKLRTPKTRTAPGPTYYTTPNTKHDCAPSLAFHDQRTEYYPDGKGCVRPLTPEPVVHVTPQKLRVSTPVPGRSQPFVSTPTRFHSDGPVRDQSSPHHGSIYHDSESNPTNANAHPNINGDRHPDLFAVPRFLRELYPPVSAVGFTPSWYVVASGYDVGIFCDAWLISKR
ncbi:hypothetical protein EYR36_010159 [Pleurotus pulmonarius]|nr:hypothetical protein EYR36_010159 [Pleurotus pulmonarius]